MGVGRQAHGEVVFDAAGGTWRLYFDVNALCLLEERVEDPGEVTRLFSGGAEAPLLQTVRAAVWCGLLANHPDVSLEDAGNIVQHVGIGEMGVKVGQAILLAFAPAKGGKPRPRMASRSKPKA